jgi:ABC-type Fe3+/spermidine/putrescine transport system ATPase subunit
MSNANNVMMLKIEGIIKSFGAKRVLDDVHLDVQQGTFVTLLGPSGCGKTTLLRIVAGFVAPDAGTVELNGNMISTPAMVIPPERRGMGMVFQNYAIWPHMNVRKNVDYGLRVRGTPAAQRTERVEEALRLVGLLGLENRLPAELSGGQQQRVSIARSVIIGPDLLLLDEPLSNLDAKLRKDMLYDLRSIQQKSGITFIYVTHDQGEALSVSEKIAVMNEGRVEQVGSPEEIYNRPCNLFVASFVGNANTLRGEVGPPVDGAMTITWGERGRLRLPNSGLQRPGTQVEVAFKRHGVILAAPAAGDEFCLALGEIKRTYFIGQADEVCVDLGGKEIYAFTPPKAFRVGAQVVVQIQPDTYQVYLRPPGHDSR